MVSENNKNNCSVLGLQYELKDLNVNKVGSGYVKHAWRIKNKSKRYRMECGIMNKNIECLCCCEVETVEYFKLSNGGYGDTTAATQTV